jgi:DNA-binding transcriptional regulator YhcF (GntR family)
MDFQNTKAIYLQIADYICEQVLLKTWQANDKIPSVRELAIQLQVNPNTVVRTYAYLEEKHIIKIQRGIGYFICDSAYQNVVVLKKQEFLSLHLPEVFKAMDLLNIDMEQFNQLFNKRKKKNEKE